jgi:hypothetical protein
MNKLSLSAIYGNVEQYMERFLRSFAPLVDEVVLVRAIGNQQPDNSAGIARKVCGELGKSLVLGEYRNDPAHDWPHVDDFAAARNLSAKLTSNEFLVWADTDDVIDPASISGIRAALDNIADNIIAIEWPYIVPDDGLTVMRERLWRKDKARWVSPIHEHLEFAEGEFEAGSIRNVIHTHVVTGKRHPNNDRNLRILEAIPEDKRTISHRFHLIQSLRAVGRVDEAVEKAVDLIQDPKIATPEKYELIVMCAQLTQKLEHRQALLASALTTDPTRREAYGELAMCALAKREPERMLAWARAMNALPKPLEWEWNHRRKYYGRLAVTIEAAARRYNKDFHGADALQENHFFDHGGKISLIHATRGRAAKAMKAMHEWVEKAKHPDAVEHIFCIDIDDAESMEFLTAFKHVLCEPQGPVNAWNTGAQASKGQVLIQLSDDWEPPLHWDEAILSRLDVSKPQVLAISDGHRQDDLLCMAIMTRERYKQQRWMFHPDFWSMYSDNWFSESAKRNGCIVDARDIVIRHLHPVFGHGELDETYKASNSQLHYDHGERHYKRLLANRITSYDVEGWCDFRNLYTAIADILPDNATFVEVGAWKGQSIIHLAQRLQDRGKSADLIAVDTFSGDADAGYEDTLQEFYRNIDAAGVNVRAIIRESVEAAANTADGSVDGVFIDASHDYDSVMADIAAWRSKVKPGGFFGGHDVDADGVRRALEDSGIKYQTIGRCWVAEQ